LEILSINTENNQVFNEIYEMLIQAKPIIASQQITSKFIKKS